MIIGIDEAGKGPVIGSMFAAAIAVPDPAILPAEVDDSKRLTASHRQELYQTLTETDEVSIGTAEVSPQDIDDPETNMNSLTVSAHARALDALSAQTTIETGDVIADAGDTNADRFARQIANQSSTDLGISASHGADSQYPVVGAASVVAKSHREMHVRDLADRYGPVGSGYPGDKQTRQFLATFYREHGEFPDCVRRSWQTCADIIAAVEQAGLEEF